MAKNRELSQLGSFIVVDDANKNIGIATTSVLQNVGIGVTNPTSKLTVSGDVLVSGVVTAKQFTGDINAGVATITNLVSNQVTITNTNVTGVVTARQFVGDVNAGVITVTTITGPSLLTIDPEGFGDNTGAVRIRGDLYVDGTQTVINSTTVDIADFRIGIGTTATNDIVLDGAGIGIGSDGYQKTFTWNNSSLSLKSSENLDISSGKTYKINGVDVLSATTLGSSVVNSSLTSVGNLNQLRVTGVTTLGNVQISAGIVTSTNPGVTTVVYYGDGSKLFGVNAFAVINQDLSSTIVYPTLANNSGVSTVGIATVGSTSFVFKPSTGNVGLGTVDPAYKLDAVGDINITGTYRVNGRSVLDDALIYSIVFG